MTSEDYIDAVDTIEMLIEETHPDCLEVVRKILAEMRFNAAFNPQFRELTRDQLEELVDELYAEAQGE